MAFDLQAFREAHRPWEITVGGRTFTARHVSAPAVVAFHEAFRRAASERTRTRLMARLLRLAFPWRFSYWWRGDPVRLVLFLEPAARKEALQDFFRHLEGRRPPSPPPKPMTPGAPSSSSSPTG